jgi:hypothetical protein
MSARGFLIRLPLTLLLAMAIWGAVRPALDRAVSSLGQLLIRSFESPRVTRLVVRDHRAEMRRSDLRAGSSIPTVDLTPVHCNTIVLLALYLAMPRPFSRRQLERLLMGGALLYLSQGVNLAFHVKFFYATGFGELNAVGIGEWSAQHYSDLAREVYGFLRHFTDLAGRFGFPFVIWLGFNWDPMIGAAEEAGQAGEKGAGARKRRRQR